MLTIKKSNIMGLLLGAAISLPALKWVISFPGPALNLIMYFSIFCFLLTESKFQLVSKNIIVTLFIFKITFLFYALVSTEQYFYNYSSNIVQLFLNTVLGILLLCYRNIQESYSAFMITVVIVSYIIIISYFILGLSTDQNFNYLTITLPLGTSLVIGLSSLYQEKVTIKMLTHVLIMVSAILFIGGRGPLIACILLPIFYLFKLNFDRRVIFVTISLFSILSILVYAAFSYGLINAWMLHKTLKFLQNGVQGELRSVVYLETLRLFAESPIFGNGFAAPTLLKLPWNEGAINPHVDSFLLELLLCFGIFSFPLIVVTFYPLWLRVTSFSHLQKLSIYFYLFLNFGKSWSLADASIMFLLFPWVIGIPRRRKE